MRIMLLNNSAFTPSAATPGQGMILAASYTLTEDVVADFAPITVPIFTPDDGFYFWTAFVKTNIASTTGLINIHLEQPGAPLTTGMTGNLAFVGPGGHGDIFITDSMFAVDGVFNVVREVTGFSGTPANYSVYVKMYRAAG